MNKGWIVGMTLMLAIVVVAPLAFAQPEGLEGYIRSDLQLISQQSKDTWSARWSGPIQAATLLAWFHDHGYTRFLRDFNGDGVIDELDTIELADILGQGAMRTPSPAGTNDARLVLGLAQFIADRYPNEFEIKIYDPGFPAEFNANGTIPFGPDAVPGVQMVLMGEPSIPDYEFEMQSGEGVILGLEVDPQQNNVYLSGRSFLFDLTPEGYTMIDLAWAEENRWQPGYQGQVLETVGQDEDRFYLDYRGMWTPVEFMIAVSPINKPSGASEPVPCAANAIAYDVTENPTPYGAVRIEECVTREGDVDTYSYTVTNIDFLFDGCGFCFFFVPDMGVTTTVGMTGPALWLQHSNPTGWYWLAPWGSCGIQPGESATFSFSVLGPTTDTWVSGALGPCSRPTLVEKRVEVPTFDVRTTGPGEGGPDDNGGPCPDLTIEIVSASCTYQRPNFVVEVEAKVTNIGTAAANTIFARLHTTSGNDNEIIPSLAPGASDNVTFTLSFSPNNPADCPLDLEVRVDPYGSIDECDETNNTDTGSVRCPDCK